MFHVSSTYQGQDITPTETAWPHLSRVGHERILAEIDEREPGSAAKRGRLLLHAIIGCLACQEVCVELWHIVSWVPNIVS